MPVELQDPAVAWRIRLESYHATIDRGFSGGEDRVELIEGVLGAMSSKGPEHEDAV